MNNTAIMPVNTTKEHLVFLDKLRESGVTNMFGAAPYLKRAFGLTAKDATDILLYWMETFEDQHV
jgi:hypothetical protein